MNSKREKLKQKIIREIHALGRQRKREKLKQRTIQAVIAARNSPERLARSLENALRFDQHLQLTPKKKTIAHQLLSDLLQGARIYKLQQKQTDIEIICANLLNAHLQNKFISVSMLLNNWKPSRYWRTSFFIPEAIKMLEKNDYITVKKGFQSKTNSRQTRIKPNKKLVEAFKDLDKKDIQFEPIEIVMLRDKDGNLIDYKDTRETRRVRSILRRVNLVNSRSIVQYIFKDRGGMVGSVETNLHAVYNRDFDHGGRLYTGTALGYQCFSEETRATFLIDNRPTIEVDFDGFYPRILYAWENIQYEEDPYSAIIPDAPELRSILKKIFLFSINCDKEITAIRACNNFLIKENHYHKVYRRGLNVKNDILPMLKKAHKPVAQYFCTDAGLKVMNTDSKIALEVIKHFADKNIPILAIHDSFIVWNEYREELKRVMQQSYSKILNGFTCPVSCALETV